MEAAAEIVDRSDVADVGDDTVELFSIAAEVALALDLLPATFILPIRFLHFI